jgi:hypothetical protein
LNSIFDLKLKKHGSFGSPSSWILRAYGWKLALEVVAFASLLKSWRQIGGDLKSSKNKIRCTRHLARVMTLAASIQMAKVAKVP